MYWSVSSNGLPNALLVSGELADLAWDAGEIVEKQVRPLVPEIGGAMAYIDTA